MPSAKPVAFLLAVWLSAAVAVSLSGVLTHLRPPAPQLIILFLAAGSLAAALLIPPFRAWADSASMRGLVSLHLTRFVGGYFLYLSGQGLLDPRFAVAAGWGDLLVSVIALILLLAVNPDTGRGRREYLMWNLIGMVDILAVVGNAARLGLSEPEAMTPLLRWPLNLLPTFLVPVIITSHLLLFRRLRGPSPDP